MSLAVRRLVFYLLLTLFLIIAPLLLAYTAGYRWSQKQNRIVKTGAMLITSHPEGAAILVNGEITGRRTPFLLMKLLPGSYEITLEKENYHRWEKNLLVESGRTTFAHTIPLFLRSIPQLLDHSDSKYVALKPVNVMLKSYKHYRTFYEPKTDTIVVVDNQYHLRLAELPGTHAIWQEKESPLLLTYSEYEIWQWIPHESKRILITRLLGTIKTVIPLSGREGIIVVMSDRIRALELDLRDRQNSWDLAIFDVIKKASLSEDNKLLLIEGIREGTEGLWKLELY